MKKNIFSALAVLLLVSGCKSSEKKQENDVPKPEKNEKYASCNMEKTSSCREYSGANLALGTDGLKDLCSISGKFYEKACSHENIIGKCTKKTHKDFYYKGYEGDVKLLKKMCVEGEGNWSVK
ncbi:MAG: hypothetical protein JXR95_04800 [Deltaproteobacteria bacterium]|nr:hypothetical protein [Deltaproteobacteria bacterium]